VIEGLDIIDKIASVATDRYDRPYEDVIIERITPVAEEPAAEVVPAADTTSKAE
jgi:hypothetical protein